MELFSARLKWIREKKGMSQREIANIIGMSAPGYGKIENGQREPNLDKLVKLSKELDESTDFLLGITDLDRSAKYLFYQYESYTSFFESFNPDSKDPALLQRKKEIRILFDRGYLKFYEYAKEIPYISESSLKKVEIVEN